MCRTLPSRSVCSSYPLRGRAMGFITVSFRRTFRSRQVFSLRVPSRSRTGRRINTRKEAPHMLPIWGSWTNTLRGGPKRKIDHFQYLHTTLSCQAASPHTPHTSLSLVWHVTTFARSAERPLAACTSSSCTSRATRGSGRSGARCAGRTSSVRPTSAFITGHTPARSRTVADSAGRGSRSRAAWGSTSAHTVGNGPTAARCVGRPLSWCTIWSGTGSFTHTAEAEIFKGMLLRWKKRRRLRTKSKSQRVAAFFFFFWLECVTLWYYHMKTLYINAYFTMQNRSSFEIYAFFF